MSASILLVVTGEYEERYRLERGVEVIKSIKSPGVSMAALIRDEDTMIRIALRKLGVDHLLRFSVNPIELVTVVEQILGVPAEPIAITTPPDRIRAARSPRDRGASSSAANF